MASVVRKGLYGDYRPFLFYFSLLILCTYLPMAFPFLGVISLSFISIFIISDIVRSRSIKNQIELSLLLIVCCLSIKYSILLSLFASGLLKLERFEGKGEKFLLTVYAITPIIVLICENLYPLGFPLGVYYIYWWGLGYIALSIPLAHLLKNNALTYLPILASGLIIVTAIITHSSSVIFIKAEQDGILNSKGAHAISIESEIVTRISPQKNLNRQTVVVPLADGVLEPVLPPTRGKERTKIVLFGEHDNMNGFIKKSKRFNPDSHRRRSPWSIYAPHMKTDLKIASFGDPLYCSNIGSTISHSWDIYPLVWEYNSTGTPVLLAASKVENGIERVFFGDSDPIVNFLAPYNLLFLQSLFSISNIYTSLALLVVCISVATISQTKQLAVAIVLIAASTFIFILFLQKPQPVLADFQLNADRKMLSPHYAHDIGSTPAAIVKAGYSVSIHSNGESANSVYLLSDDIKHNDLSVAPGINIVFMLPGSTYYQNNTSYRSLLPPMGTVIETQITDKSNGISVIDARNIQSESGHKGSIVQIGNIFLIGTDSPQRNVHILKYLLDKTS